MIQSVPASHHSNAILLIPRPSVLDCQNFLLLQAVFTVLPVRFVRALGSCLAASRQTSGASQLGAGLQGQQLVDILCVAMFAITFLFLRSLDAGSLYFWMKDLTQEFLKLQVIYTAVEMFDKVSEPTLSACIQVLKSTCSGVLIGQDASLGI